MTIMTLEGVIENGKIRLNSEIWLPEKTRVYIIVPAASIKQVARVVSPRLAHPEQIEHFKLEVVEEANDARL